MKLNFKQPKYVIPLIALPFLGLFYYAVSEWKGKDKKTVKSTVDSSKMYGQINTDMPGVSNEVAKSGINDKYKAYLQTYKDAKDQSALNGIENKTELQGETEDPFRYRSAYSAEDIRKIQAQKSLDSLRKIMDNNRKTMDKRMSSLMNKNNAGNRSYNNNGSSQKSAEEIIASLNKIKNGNNKIQNDAVEGQRSYEQDMRLFREQMKYADSMQKARQSSLTGNSSNLSENTPVQNHSSGEKGGFKDSNFKPLSVSLARAAVGSAFNTARFASSDFNIKAIIDENEKAFAGTRIRIRLLDDIAVGNNVVPKGTYLYGQVSGFQSQRVNISITQILYGNEILPVKLDVFDNDGYLGLYVPGSNFREFTKEIGTQGTGGLSSIQFSNGSSDVTTGILMKLFQTTTSSAGKYIRKDKAFLKYNHIIILKEKAPNP